MTAAPALARLDAPEVLRFIGVSTAGSAIQRAFLAWAEALSLGASARLEGVDLPLGASDEAYRAVVTALRDDPRVRGALVTTHKIAIFRACRDLFDEVDPHAARLGEASCLARRPDGRLAALATDPATSARALSSFLPPGHFARGGAAAVLGAGGAGTAIAWNLARADAPWGRPSRLLLTERDPVRLAAARAALGTAPLECLLVTDTAQTGAALATLPSGSLVVNATGLGKDRPGSPIASGADLPRGAIAWELNYRGTLEFLHQARGEAGRGVCAEDGWTYFLHGWLAVIGEVFGCAVPSAGPLFDRLGRIAAEAASSAA